MSAFVLISFDLKGHPTAEQYEDIKEELAQYGLHDYVISDQGRTVNLPSTTYAGKFKETPDKKQLADILKQAVGKAGATLDRWIVLVTDGGWGWIGSG